MSQRTRMDSDALHDGGHAGPGLALEAPDSCDGDGRAATATTAAAPVAVVPDRVFATPRVRPEDFSFNKDVAAAFDDMLDRSVPFYGETQRMVAELAADFAQPGTNVYDQIGRA